MLRSLQTYLVPDDVSVPCRVRHSETAGGDTQQQFTERQDMICTMRVWHKTSQPSTTAVAVETTNGSAGHRRISSGSLILPSSEFRNSGPELVLTPVSNPRLATSLTDQHQAQQLCCGGNFGEHLASFGGSGSPSSRGWASARLRMSTSGNDFMQTSVNPCRTIGTVTIPMKEILQVGLGDTRSNSSNTTKNHNKNTTYQTTVTTASSGFYELNMDNMNGQMVLTAFLKANLPKNKLNEDVRQLYGLPRCPSNVTENTQSTKSFDVEAFTASRMTERLQRESVAEKVQQRIHRLVTSLEEMSSSITECGCPGCDDSNHASISPEPLHERRDSPPLVEMAGSESLPSIHGDYRKHDNKQNAAATAALFEMKPSSKYNRRHDMLKARYLPSGLSVESDPETEASTVSGLPKSAAVDP